MLHFLVPLLAGFAPWMTNRQRFGQIRRLLSSITYLGQHYVIDAVVGFAYAALGYALVLHIAPAVGRRFQPARSAALERSPALRPEMEEA